MKNDSTPSEGWASELQMHKKQTLSKASPEIKGLDVVKYYDADFVEEFITELIAKARQEITDWSLEQQEKAYSIGRDIGRQEERREIVDKLKDACSDYCFIGDGSSDSSEETMRMSEHLIKHMGLEYLEEE
jgi:hypothetical protein